MMQTWARWRIPFMLLVYVLFFAHVALFHHFGWTHVGHLGFGELFGTLATGLVTAGTIFTLAVFLWSLLFGGMFCGWLCHWGILQDLAAGLLRRLGLAPRMVRVRSRLIPWVWFSIMLGQVAFAWYHSGLPTAWSFDAGATAVWSGVPRSLFQVGLTVVVSCFLIVFLFGERGFCRTICVFKLWFSGFEKIAPWRIRRVHGCGGCRNECDAACPMGLDVSGELKAHGAVHDSECIKCMDCAVACPQQTIAGGFAATVTPADILPYTPPAPDLDGRTTLYASLTAFVAMLAGTMVIGGNMSLTLGFIGGLVLLRLYAQGRLSAFELVIWPLLAVGLAYRIDMNDLTSLGKALAAVAAFLVIARLLGEGGWREYLHDVLPKRSVPTALLVVLALVVAGWGAHTVRLGWLSAAIQGAKKQKNYAELSCMLESYLPHEVDRAVSLFELGKTRLAAGDAPGAETALRESQALQPDSLTAHLLYLALVAQNRNDDAKKWLWSATASCSAAVLWRERARLEMNAGEMAAAVSSFEKVLTENASDTEAHFDLGRMLMVMGRAAEAEAELRFAHRLDAKMTAATLARCLAARDRPDQAVPLFNEAIGYRPGDPTLYFDLGIALARQDRLQDAIKAWERVMQLDPNCQEARDNIDKAKARLISYGLTPAAASPTSPGVASSGH